jgi:hypothetical protein
VPEVDEAVAPVGEPEQSSFEATDEGETTDPTPSLAELINDDNLEEVLKSEAVQKTLAQRERAAMDRAEAKLRSEQRKALNPDVVTQAAAQVLSDAGIDASNLTRSQRDRLTNLYGNVRQAAAEQLAEEIPKAFWSNYELPGEVISGYHEAISQGDVDRAIQTLVDGAVSQKTAAYEAAAEKRVKTEVEKRVKQELEAAREGGPVSLPNTSKGSRPSNTSAMLTTAEIERMPYSTWKNLPNEVRTAIEANVGKADAERGKETVDPSRLERVAGLVQ